MMKKYLGSPVDAFAAIVAPMFVCLPIPFAICTLSEGVDVARIILLLGGAFCVGAWGAYLKQIRFQLYSWGHFFDTSVKVKTFFARPYFIVYKKCFGCGIGYYTHGILNSQVGTKIYYIFLSYGKFDEQYRTRMNLWRPTQTRIKVKFSKEIYDYLIEVLPKAQSQALEQDYRQYYKQDRG